jgi:hypothetical protein
VEGVLQSASNQIYRVEFFLNEKTDETLHGEGQTFLGFISVTITNGLPSPFAFALPGLLETNQLITATATDSSFNTSEFSRGVAELLGPPVVDDNPGATNVVPGQDVTLCATASGTPPIRYQWRLNGVNIPGETNRCLTISAVQYSDGGTYTVLVENPLGAASSLAARLLVQAPILRGGDNFADRTQVTGTRVIYLSDNKGATREEGEPRHAGKTGGKSVWYTWKAPFTGVVTVETRGSTFDTLLGIYSGSTLANLLSRASDEDRGGFYTSRTRFNAIKNREYHFAVDGFGAAEGDFNLGLDVQDTPHLLPGFHTQPLSQTVAPGSAVTFSAIATRYCGNGHENCPNPNDYPKDELPTMAYQWLFYGSAIPGATTTSLTIANVQPENLGLYSMSVTTGWQTNETEVANLQINVTGDAAQNVQSADKLLDSQGGTPLFVGAVETAQGAVPGEPGTSTAGAVVSGYTGSQVFNTAGSATGPSEIICGVVGGASQWITYVPLQSGTLFLNTDGSSYDTVMAVFRRSPANPAILEQLGCDNNSGPGGTTSAVTVPVTAGQTNYVLVDGVNGASGTLRFNYSLATPVTLSALEPALGKARIRVNSRPNLRFSIQATTNLVDWETLTTTNSAEALLDYVDPAPLYERRFYRAVVLP